MNILGRYILAGALLSITPWVYAGPNSRELQAELNRLRGMAYGDCPADVCMDGQAQPTPAKVTDRPVAAGLYSAAEAHRSIKAFLKANPGAKADEFPMTLPVSKYDPLYIEGHLDASDNADDNTKAWTRKYNLTRAAVSWKKNQRQRVKNTVAWGLGTLVTIATIIATGGTAGAMYALVGLGALGTGMSAKSVAADRKEVAKRVDAAGEIQLTGLPDTAKVTGPIDY